MRKQRAYFRKERLPGHMVTKLRGLGIDLAGKGRPFGVDSEEGWQAKYDCLVQYVEEHGDADVPYHYEADRELGHWTKSQRDAYAAGALPDRRVRALARQGFNLYAKAADPWQRRLGELKAYKRKVGNTDVPKHFTLNRSLGEFVYQQKMASRGQERCVAPDC